MLAAEQRNLDAASRGARSTTTLAAWTSASATSPTHDGDRSRARSRAWSSSAATSRCSSPSTRTSRRAARPPIRPGESCRASTATRYDLFVALTAAAAATTPAARRQRHLPGHRARPDHHRQGGRERRPPLRRAPGVRRRRGLEPRGDAQPRHRPARADGADGGADRGDEGDLDAGRGQLPRRVRQLRAHLVVAQAGAAAASAGARRRQRADGARSRAPLRRRLDAELSRETICSSAMRGAVGAGRAADRRDRDGRCRPSRRCSRSSRRPACAASCTGCRRRGSGRSSARWSAGRTRSRSSTESDRGRGAAALRGGERRAPGDGRRTARAPRAASRADRRSRSTARRSTASSTPSPSARTELRAAAERRGQPARLRARRPLRGRLERAVVGPRRREPPACWSVAERRGRARDRGCSRARYPQQRADRVRCWRSTSSAGRAGRRGRRAEPARKRSCGQARIVGAHQSRSDVRSRRWTSNSRTRSLL